VTGSGTVTDYNRKYRQVGSRHLERGIEREREKKERKREHEYRKDRRSASEGEDVGGKCGRGKRGT